VLVAPASADVLSAAAHGEARDMLQTILVAYDGQVLFAPAMNPSMFASEAVVAARRILEERGAHFVEPDEGDVACGEQGQGKLAAIPRIVEAAMAVLQAKKLYEGKTILITSGPTQEPVDGVRFLSNRSSGRMGMALGRAGLMMGARVVLVTGPTAEVAPTRAHVVRVRTAQEMLEAATRLAPEADLIVGAAAVADYRPAEPQAGKMRRGEETIELKLVRNPDVLASAARAAKKGAKVVGFAAEPDEGLETARRKREGKGLYAIAVNDVSRSDIGFEAAENELTLVKAEGAAESSGKLSKLRCALWLLERVAE
jgi:phosphopantothenoylcysteine decarboxylase / phosphopantothenate---cysteine ligase